MSARLDVNEHGVMISHNVCEACGAKYTLTPACVTDTRCNRPPGTDGPEDKGCVAYDPACDVDKMLREGAVLVGTPAKPRGES